MAFDLALDEKISAREIAHAERGDYYRPQNRQTESERDTGQRRALIAVTLLIWPSDLPKISGRPFRSREDQHRRSQIRLRSSVSSLRSIFDRDNFRGLPD